MNNHPIHMPTQPLSNALDPRHIQTCNVVVSPPPAPARDQFQGNYSNFSPYYHSPDQHMHESVMYPRDCHYDHMSMTPPPNAFNNCWNSPHGCHHAHPEMGYNFCVPPPFPHYQYGCCAPTMNDKMSCNKMPSHQVYQKKPYSSGFTPYRSRRRKQVSFQNVGQGRPQQHETAASGANYEQLQNGSSLAAPMVQTISPGDSASSLPPGYKVFNISVEATPSGYQMSAPDGLTLSEEHIENILKVVNTGKAVYTPSNFEGSAEGIAPNPDTSLNQKYMVAPSLSSKTDLNPSLMAGDAGTVYYERGSGETVPQEMIQQQESGVHYSSPSEATPTSESSQPDTRDTIVIQKSVYCHSTGTMEKLPQEYIHLSSSNLGLYDQNDVGMSHHMAGNNTILQVDMQQPREVGEQALQSTKDETRENIAVGSSDVDSLAEQCQEMDEHNAVSAAPEAYRQRDYDLPPEDHGRNGIEEPSQSSTEQAVDCNSQESIAMRQESDIETPAENVSVGSSEEDIFISVTDITDSQSPQE